METQSSPSSARTVLKLVLFIGLFSGLSAGGVFWVLSRTGVSSADLASIWNMGPALIAVVLSLCVGIYVTDVIRYRIIAWALGVRLGLRACLDASVANFFFSWVTPGAALGAPATVFMLTRHGVSLDAAVLIAFGKSMTGVAFLLLAAFAVLAAGAGPIFDLTIAAVVVPGAAVVAGTLSLPLLAALWPERSTRLVRRIEAWCAARKLLAGPRTQKAVFKLGASMRTAIERLVRLRRGGIKMVLLIGASHLVYFAVFIGIGVVLAQGLGANDPIRAAATTTVYLAFSYVAPTPGAAGLAEAVAVPFYEGLMSAKQAAVFAIAFRSVTFYLDVAFGFVYLLVVGGLLQILRSGKKRAPVLDPQDDKPQE
jgi:uncharacterized protein (TIRG00374 family)